MNKIIHRAGTRGYANYGWLETFHNFSFNRYYDPERLHFGKLRVLNDDIVQPNTGFGKHPHENMEIITIPLSGALSHEDSAGHQQTIHSNDVQIMSAGSGIVHSEYNHSDTEPVNLLQIWVLPKTNSLAPCYNQSTFDPAERKNKWQTLVSPEKNINVLFINQDAYFTRGFFSGNQTTRYSLHIRNNGLFVFLIAGSIRIAGEQINHRDAIGLNDMDAFEIDIIETADILLIETPMD